MNIGPKQPIGLTPCSLYKLIVSLDCLCLSSLYLDCISLIRGCRAVIAFICLLCLTVKGIIRPRINIVKMIIATPKLLNDTLYNTIRVLIIGAIITEFQISMKSSKF